MQYRMVKGTLYLWCFDNSREIEKFNIDEASDLKFATKFIISPKKKMLKQPAKAKSPTPLASPSPVCVLTIQKKLQLISVYML